jgi:hypothetical protein
MSQLSKGNAQKIALAQALCSGARLLVLDEPWSGLDPAAAPALAGQIAARADEGAAVLISDHTRIARGLPDRRLLRLDAGRLAAQDGSGATQPPPGETVRITLVHPHPARFAEHLPHGRVVGITGDLVTVETTPHRSAATRCCAPRWNRGPPSAACTARWLIHPPKTGRTWSEQGGSGDRRGRPLPPRGPAAFPAVHRPGRGLPRAARGALRRRSRPTTGALGGIDPCALPGQRLVGDHHSQHRGPSATPHHPRRDRRLVPRRPVITRFGATVLTALIVLLVTAIQPWLPPVGAAITALANAPPPTRQLLVDAAAGLALAVCACAITVAIGRRR